jgi:hypothetical protein
MASASSKNIMLGADRRALWNVLRNKVSPSPTYFEYSSAPLVDNIAQNIDDLQRVHTEQQVARLSFYTR